MARLTLSIWYKKGSLAFDNIQFRCSLPLGHRHGNRPLKVGLGNDEDKYTFSPVIKDSGMMTTGDF